MTLPERMIRFRAAGNMGQAKAAQVAGVSTQTWCNVETGKQKPSRLTEAKIEIVLQDNERRLDDESINITDQDV